MIYNLNIKIEIRFRKLKLGL